MNVSLESSALASPSTSVVIASDTVSGIDYQRVKVSWGTTGSITEITTLAGLPVQVVAGDAGSMADVESLFNQATGATVATVMASLTASATTTTSGNQIVAPPAAGTQVKVVSLFLVCGAATNLQFGSSAGTVYTGVTTLSSNSGYVLPFNPVGWFGASSSTAPVGLYVYLSAPSIVGGAVTYVSV